MALRPFGSLRGPAITTVAPDHVLELLTSKDWTSDVGTLAIEIVKTQLANHETCQKVLLANTSANADNVPSLFDLAVLKIGRSIGDNSEEDMRALSALPPSVLSRAVLSRAAHGLANIPYHSISAHLTGLSQAYGVDIDEWVLRNERWLRDSSVPVDVLYNASSSKKCRGEQAQKITQDSSPVDWTLGLVRLSSHAENVFPDSVLTKTSRAITRPNSLSGFKVLDGRRLSIIHIQPSVEMFAQTFNEMTNGLLKGLNWDNVFIAGGIALGALLCTKDEAINVPEQWKSSDVDLYIHGLGPVEANKKVQHIFDVFKSNVPTGGPVLVVRNSKTITLFSKYPVRRIQVVLKLVSSPKDVLLNFDLDICSVGWDGEEVWMLPRAARALETGYTVFTMDLINGHYLGDRRATQEQRVFKYADKGYGICILPCYLEELKVMRNDPDNRKSLGTSAEALDAALDVEKIALEAREWTAEAIKALIQFYTYQWPPAILVSPFVTSHAEIQEKYQCTEDPPRRSCMSGLGIFMRHVALWEHELAGDIVIKKGEWAAQTYDHLDIGYNDAPDYSWNDDFTTEEFIKQITMFNQSEVSRLNWDLRDKFPGPPNTPSPWTSSFAARQKEIDNLLVEGSTESIQRMTHAASAHEILQPECDIILPLWLPRSFFSFVAKLAPEKARESGVRDYTTEELVEWLKADITSTFPDEAPILVQWRITSVTMWQQLNRAIDEVHEVLWSFHHANATDTNKEEVRVGTLLAQIGRRAIRQTAQDESMAFARWVSRESALIQNTFGSPLYDIDHGTEYGSN